jgi:hypothetical protein
MYLFADDDEENNRFSLSAGFTYATSPSFLGGHFDFGIVLYKKILYIQNNFSLRGGGLSSNGNEYTIFTLSDKLIFGRNSQTPLGIYTYIEGGIGMFANENKKFSEAPFAYSLGFGGGGELSSDNFGGIYVEVGYLGQKTDSNYPLSGIIIQTGWRIFF